MIPGGVRIFVCSAPVALRHGFDRLAQTARERMGADPTTGGALFVFRQRLPSRRAFAAVLNCPSPPSSTARRALRH